MRSENWNLPLFAPVGGELFEAKYFIRKPKRKRGPAVQRDWINSMQDDDVDDDQEDTEEIDRGLITCKTLIDKLKGTIQLFQDCDAQKTII